MAQNVYKAITAIILHTFGVQVSLKPSLRRPCVNKTGNLRTLEVRSAHGESNERLMVQGSAVSVLGAQGLGLSVWGSCVLGSGLLLQDLSNFRMSV